jgi:hypothetical protein
MQCLHCLSNTIKRILVRKVQEEQQKLETNGVLRLVVYVTVVGSVDSTKLTATEEVLDACNEVRVAVN